MRRQCRWKDPEWFYRGTISLIGCPGVRLALGAIGERDAGQSSDAGQASYCTGADAGLLALGSLAISSSG